MVDPNPCIPFIRCVLKYSKNFLSNNRPTYYSTYFLQEKLSRQKTYRKIEFLPPLNTWYFEMYTT